MNSSLQQFSLQITTWIQNLIEHGRTPFRRVERLPRIWTRDGYHTPDLVLWINRQSCMAGGVLLFPAGPEEAVLDTGQAVAEALGLRHFVSWGMKRLVIWEYAAHQQPRPLRTWPLSKESAESAFVGQLRELLDQLKTLAVQGAVPVDSLSPEVLVNLCLQALEEANPALAEAFRLHPATASLDEEERRAWETEKAVLTLVRLLAIAGADLLPEKVAADKLERALTLALPRLEKGCRRFLNFAGDELPLPQSAAVAFHHLFRRLIQLRWHARPDLRRAMLDGLLAACCTLLECTPAAVIGEEAGSALLVAPAAIPPLPPPGPTLLAPPPLAALLAYRAGLSPVEPSLQIEDSLSRLSSAPEAGYALITGRIGRQQRLFEPSAQEVLLRRSWPHRRFGNMVRAPAWTLVTLSLLGLVRPGGEVRLQTPGPWVASGMTRTLLELLQEQYALIEVTENASGELGFAGIRNASPPRAIRLTTVFGPRNLPADRFYHNDAGLLLYALRLPDKLWQALLADRLQPLSPVPREGFPARGLELFLGTPWGELLRRTAGLVSLPRGETPEQRCRAARLPVPETATLRDLEECVPPECSGRDARELATRHVARILGLDPAPPVPVRPRPVAGEPAHHEPLEARAFPDGLPRFPEHYLYRYYRPALTTFELPGPLRFMGNFFGQMELAAEDGSSFKVDGEELAWALLLTSGPEPRSVSLPTDQPLLAEILRRYLRDLRQLRAALLAEARKDFSDDALARRRVDEAWRRSGLPPWPLVERICGVFNPDNLT